MQPNPPSDSQLLADWLDHRRDAAFRELVSRYAGLVHMAARRVTGDDGLAADAAQLTFILLARKARSLAGRISLAGWLHHTAVWQAKDLLRKARRESRKCEHFQAAMDTDPAHTEAWHELAPALDDALGSLAAADREALLLRFYRSLSVKEIAAILGIATDAAQKRIDRATARLRGKLVRLGCQTGGSLSAVMLAGFAGDAQAAAFAVPLFTAKAIAAAAVSSGAFTATTAFLTASAMKTTSVAVPLVMVIAAVVWLAGQFRLIAELEDQNALLTKHLAADERVAFPRSKTVASSVPLLDGKTIDWEAVGERLASDREQFGEVGSRTPGGRWLERMDEQLAGMKPRELTTALDQIAQTSLSEQARRSLELQVLWHLGKKDSEMALARLIDRCGDPEWAGFVADLFEGWLKREPEPATAWFVRQLAAAMARHQEAGRGEHAGSRLAGYPELANLALACHPIWNRPADFLDGLFIRLLETDQAGYHRELARSIAERLSDRTQRAMYLVKFK